MQQKKTALERFFVEYYVALPRIEIILENIPFGT